jgi:type VI secretion system secreted protein Hcp
MALTGYGQMEGMSQGPIKGDCNQAKYLDWIMIYGIDHGIKLPANPLTGMPTGQRQHQPYKITKAVDTASPLLYQACTSGEHMKKCNIVYNRINERGQEEQYFGVTLENAIIVAIRHYKPLTLLEENKPYHDMEEISLSYTKIIWQHTVANMEAADDWASRE